MGREDTLYEVGTGGKGEGKVDKYREVGTGGKGEGKVDKFYEVGTGGKGEGKVDKYREVGVIEDQRLLGPRPVEPRPIRVSSPQGVGAGEGNDLPVDEAHAVEDITEVLVALLSVGQTAIRRDLKEGGMDGREGGTEGDGVSVGEGQRSSWS